jgi:putative SOS response-associated peptidase YedK
MCGRATLVAPPRDLEELFGLQPTSLSWAPRYNIAPTEPVAVIRRQEDGHRVLSMVRWGLVPSFADEVGVGSPRINLRVESLGSTRSRREALASRRCLVVVDGFYEWTHDKPRRVPYYVKRVDARPMALAGLWDVWRGPGPGGGAERLESCAIVTVPARAPVSKVHDRMPLVVPPGLVEQWLDPARTTPADLSLVLGAVVTEGELESYAVHPRVNSTSEDHPENIVPFELQPTLFG